jgi:hypothetical protein
MESTSAVELFLIPLRWLLMVDQVFGPPTESGRGNHGGRGRGVESSGDSGDDDEREESERKKDRSV